MNKKEEIYNFEKDNEFNIVGIPINSNQHLKKSTKSEFWKELGTIFISADDMIGLSISIFLAIIFTIKWTFYLIKKYIFRFNVSKPTIKNKKK